MTSRNPHTTEGRAVQRASAMAVVEYGYVVDVEPHTEGLDDNKHVVSIQPSGKSTTLIAEVAVMSEGDVNIPDESNIPVLFTRRAGDLPLVLGYAYSDESDVPSYEPGERRLGHALSDANVFFDKNGDVWVESDDGTTVKVTGGVTIEASDGTTVEISGSQVIVDGGTNEVLTDVTVSTTTDADGHVTSVSLNKTFSNDVLVN